jgi:hypothetical protein
VVHASARFRRVPQSHIARQHLARSNASAHATTQQAKGQIRYSRHWRQRKVVDKFVLTNLHGVEARESGKEFVRGR